MHAAGERYDGEWREGLEDGIGVFTWQDGSTYEGFWSQVGAAACMWPPFADSRQARHAAESCQHF
jgi:hypothetical protein